MDILSDYRISALTVSEHELARRAEWSRIADERAMTDAPEYVATSTGSLACVPVSH